MGLTVTRHVTLFPPVIAVIIVDPTFSAVILPELFTVTIVVSSELQLTILFVAFDGLTVAISV